MRLVTVSGTLIRSAMLAYNVVLGGLLGAGALSVVGQTPAARPDFDALSTPHARVDGTVRAIARFDARHVRREVA